MFAVIKTGGKEYRVTEGTVIKVEKLPGDVGSVVEIPEVLAVGEGKELKVGTPVVTGALVSAEVVEHGKDKKVTIFKKRRRKGYTKKQGHRQSFTSLKIKEIKA